MVGGLRRFILNSILGLAGQMALKKSLEVHFQAFPRPGGQMAFGMPLELHFEHSDVC